MGLPKLDTLFILTIQQSHSVQIDQRDNQYITKGESVSSNTFHIPKQPLFLFPVSKRRTFNVCALRWLRCRSLPFGRLLAERPGGSASTSPTTTMTTRRGNCEAHSSEAVVTVWEGALWMWTRVREGFYARSRHTVPKEFSQEIDSIHPLKKPWWKQFWFSSAV